MRLPEDGPKCGPKHVATIKTNVSGSIGLLYCCVHGHDTQQDANSQESNRLFEKKGLTNRFPQKAGNFLP
jgi:hypothetical protein